MKVLYLDCSFGVSEARLLGALIECGANSGELAELLSPTHASFTVITAESCGVSGATVDLGSLRRPSLSHVTDLADLGASLPVREWLRDALSNAASRLVEAGVSLSDVGEPANGAAVSSGELRAMACCAVALDRLGVESVVCSPVNLGSGPRDGSECAGAAVAARLAVGLEIAALPGASSVVSPGGLAMLCGIVTRFGPLPPLRLEASGCGVGPAATGSPDILLAYLGETQTVPELSKVVVLETNLDDMPAQLLDHVMTQLLEKGALDVYFTPIQMKKNRPAVMVSVICGAEKQQACTDLLLRETTTLGVRATAADRRCLERHFLTVETPHGPVPVKAAILHGRVRSVMPEYDVCREIAVTRGVPLQQVREAASSMAWESLRRDGWERL